MFIGLFIAENVEVWFCALALKSWILNSKLAFFSLGNNDAHLNRDKIESNLSLPGIQGRYENALIKSFEMSPHLICQ